MMQSNIIKQALVASGASPTTLVCSKTAASGQIFQVRHHVKMYPWRFNRTARESYLDNTRTPYTDKYNINEFKSHRRQLKPWQKVIYKEKDNRFNAYNWNDAYTSNPKVAKSTALQKLDSLSQSLQDRGFARSRKAYTPPDNVADQILTICKNIGLQDDAQLNDRELKFKLISSCMEVFSHDMPGSFLNDMNTIRDVVDYFSTEVIGLNPYENLVNNANTLPPNLAILAEPARYNRESDECFKGYNALPGIISSVPGLRASKKYPVLNQDEFQWPDI